MLRRYEQRAINQFTEAKKLPKVEGPYNAIIVAQETAEDPKQNAMREAELVRRGGREAQRIIEETRYRSSRFG